MCETNDHIFNFLRSTCMFMPVNTSVCMQASACKVGLSVNFRSTKMMGKDTATDKMSQSNLMITL